MPAPLANGDVIEVKFGCFCAGQAGINVTHWVITTPDGTKDLQDLALAFDNHFHADFKDCIASDATFYGVRAQIIDPLPLSVAEVSAAHIGTGNVGNGAALPTQVSSIITLTTLLAGRANRGRVYVPFPGNADNDPILNTPTNLHVAELDALMLKLTSTFSGDVAMGALVLEPYLWHRATRTKTLVDDGVARQKWATQRRRGNYGQTNTYPPF